VGNHSDRFVDLQTRLGSEDHVRVRGRFGEVVTRRPTLTTDSLLPAPDSAGRPGAHVSLHDVTSIQVLGGAAATGALVGAGVGVGGGLAVSMALSASLCSDGGCANETGGSAVITLGSAAAGALLGALIGAPLKRWHTVYRSR